jgi:hypothetical protein
LLEATRSSTEEGEHKQESSKEDPSTPPHPKRLMLALFIEKMTITIAIQLSSQGRESPLSYRGEGIGPPVDVILVGFIFCVVMADCIRYMHADVEDKAFFSTLFTEGIVIGLAIGLAMQALSLIVAGGVKNNPWLMYLYIVVSFLLAFLIGYFFFISFLGDDEWSSRFQQFLGCYGTGLSLGYFTSFLLAFANMGLHEGARPKLLSVMLSFFFAGAVAYFQAVIIAVAQKEERYDDKEDEVENTTSAEVANKTLC